ncbi:hypothetical protein LTR08_002667 [Meristemomyces frigidus]|nr:hypothetical protein LTR08_002667 [Meristemomyces frigidus]
MLNLKAMELAAQDTYPSETDFGSSPVAQATAPRFPLVAAPSSVQYRGLPPSPVAITITEQDMLRLKAMELAAQDTFPTETDLGSPVAQGTANRFAESQPTRQTASPVVEAAPLPAPYAGPKNVRRYIGVPAFPDLPDELSDDQYDEYDENGEKHMHVPKRWSAAYRLGKLKAKFEKQDQARSRYLASAAQTTRVARDVELDNLTKKAALVALRDSNTIDSTVSYREKKRIAKEKAEEEAREAREQDDALQAQIAESIKKEAEREEAAEVARREAEEAAKVAEEVAKQAEEAAKVAEDIMEVEIDKDQLIRPLDPKWNDKVNKVMLETNPSKILAQSAFTATDIDRKAFGRLLPTGDKTADGAGHPGWLNDETVNAWFEAIVEHKKTQTGYVKGPRNTPAFEAYNSGWYHTFKTKGVKGLEGWSRRKGIKGAKLLAAEKIFFPINGGGHWMLIVISPKTKTIEYLDSLRSPQKYYMNVARDWLEMELGSQYVKGQWTELGSVSGLQGNNSDCGVFTCMNALAVAKGRGFDDVPSTKMMEARRMMVAVLLNGGLHGDWEL